MATTDIKSPAGTTAVHPLEPLTEEEVTAATGVLREQRGLGDGVLFVSVALHEPSKDAVLAFDGSPGIDRQAFVVLRDRTARKTYEAVVSVIRGEVTSWREVEGVQPPFTLDEVFGAVETVMTHPGWQAAVRARGIDDVELAAVDPWPAGHYGPAEDPSRRLARVLTWVRSEAGGNAYARPIEGLVVLVDLDRMEVVDLEDHGPVPVPPKDGDYWPEAIVRPSNHPRFPGVRDDLRRIDITQPDGVSFTVDGHEVTWHKWRFRVGFTPREGLVLHQVAFDDRGRWRPVLYRASLAEMVVPYGDPHPTHWRKNAFDEGEAGFGWLANSLERGCDCLGEIHYFDAVVADTQGRPQRLPNAVCMHEEDFNISWKHFDFQTERTEVRRRRRLVLSQVSTIANYEYGLFWYFYEDGTIELEMKSTGIVSTGAIQPGATPEFGTLIAPGLYAPNHQHFYCFRLDMSVDGPRNSVYEVQSGRAAPEENPHGNAWRVTETLLDRESEAQRVADPLTGRHWKVVNPDVAGPLGQPVAYRLLPAASPLPFFTAESAVAHRAGFATRHLWVTAFDERERYAAGDYPNQHAGGDGLPRYAGADRSLEAADVVLWPVIGSHHPVRAEDWPVMPVTSTGFVLQPAGFFDGNPALDLARPNGGACHAH